MDSWLAILIPIPKYMLNKVRAIQEFSRRGAGDFLEPYKKTSKLLPWHLYCHGAGGNVLCKCIITLSASWFWPVSWLHPVLIGRVVRTSPTDLLPHQDYQYSD